MAGTTVLPPTFFCQNTLVFSPSQKNSRTKLAKDSSFVFDIEEKRRGHIRCSAKKKISFVDQILDYIEGGPKLRKWYGAPDLIPKDESEEEDQDKDEDEYPDEVKDAVLVTEHRLTSEAATYVFLVNQCNAPITHEEV